MAVRVFFVFVVCAIAQSSVAERAAKQIQAGDFAGAAALVRAGLKTNASDVTLWNFLGICETELHHSAAARDAFARGLKLAPDSPELNENAGFLYYREGDYKTAKTYLAKAIALGSDKPGVAFSLAAARIRTGERADGLAQLKSLESALGSVADYWDERGWAELPGNAPAAEADFQRALALAPSDLSGLNGAATAAESEQDDEKALSYLLRAKEARPDDVPTLIHFGKVCIRRDLNADALKALEHAHQLDPKNDTALYLYARAEIGMRQWQKAYDLFSDFARRQPRFPPVHYALAWLDLQLGRAAAARGELERCLSLAPNYPDPQYELAQLDLNDGNLDAAEKLLRAVLHEEPRHVRANLAFGDVMMRRGNPAEAETHYRIAADEEPALGSAHYKLSTALLRLHRPEEAEKERVLGMQLSAEEQEASRVVLHLAAPDGTLLSSDK